MIEQKQSNAISKVVGAVFIFFGFLMLILGISLLFSEDKGEFENTLMALFLLSGLGMIVGGIQGIRTSYRKEKDLNLYEEQVKKQLRAMQAGLKSPSAQTSVNSNSESEEYIPDIIATWNYTRDEWKLMTKEETLRRLKEGIWVTLGIGLIGGLFLWKSRGESFLFSFLLCSTFGLIISLLKVLISNKMFMPKSDNTIIITTNGLFINKKFKTIQDDQINLEYIIPVNHAEHDFLEFSLKWQTRRGMTNDQFRIYIPPKHENEMQKVLDYYKAKGVRTWE